MTQPLADPVSADTAQLAEDAHYYRRALHRLIDVGVGLTERLAAVKGEDTAPGAATAEAYERITRSVRRSIGLAQRLGEPVRAAGRRAQDRVATRRRIIRAVEDAIQREAGQQEAGGTEAENLQDELLERLDGPDLEDDIDNRPAAEIIADICRDLGLGAMPGAHPWQRRTPEDIAILCAQAAGPRDETGKRAAAPLGRDTPAPERPEAARGGAPLPTAVQASLGRGTGPPPGGG